MDVCSYVALVRQQRCPRVEADTDADRTGRENICEGQRCIERSRCRWKREEEGVALCVDLGGALRSARLANDAAMLGERLGVRLRAELLQQPGRPLHIREEERDRTGGEIASHLADHATALRHCEPARSALGPDPASLRRSRTD